MGRGADCGLGSNPPPPEIRQNHWSHPLRELQSVVNLIPGLIKALPILAAYLLLLRFVIAQVKAWKQPIAGQELAYALIGIAAILWAIGR